MSVLDSFRLDGQRAIVTGASRGLGAAMAIALAEAGADVALVAREKFPKSIQSDPEFIQSEAGGRAGAKDLPQVNQDVPSRDDLGEIAKKITALNRRALPIPADLSDRTAPATIMKAVTKEWNGADILVNNAGIIRRANAIDTTDDDWDAVIEVNLRSVFTLSREFAKALVEQKRPGRIINIVSMLSFQGGIRVPAYTAAKSGLLGLTRALANELAPLNINVNAIAPGYMATDNTQALRDDPQRSRDILARIPAARWGAPEDLQGAVVFLASPAASYIHGTVLGVDGGWLGR